MSVKHKRNYKNLNYFGHFPLFISSVSGCVWISTFVSLVDIPIGIKISTVGLKICAITSVIKSICQLSRNRRKSIIKEGFLLKLS